MVEAGQRIEDFELHDVSGRPVRLIELQERGPVVIAFFKITCPVCQFTMPFLERLAASGQVPVVGISQDDAEATQTFRQSYRLNFPMLIDPAREGYRVSNAFGITNVPSIFTIEKDNRVSAAFSGFSRADLAGLGHAFHAQIFQEGESTPEFKPG